MDNVINDNRRSLRRCDERRIRAVASVIQRYRDKNAFYHPGNVLSGEWHKSRNASNTGFIPGSRIDLMSDREWKAECDAVNLLAPFWGGKTCLDTKPKYARLLGSIALDSRVKEAYLLAERDTFDPEKEEYVPSKAPVYTTDILDAARRFRQLFGFHASIPRPLFAWRQRSDEFKAREGEQVADLADHHRATRKLWHFCTVCSAQQLMGELLMQPDYGLSDLGQLERLGATFDDYWQDDPDLPF